MADISKISPDNGTTIYNLKDIEARKRVPEVLLKDTVGWTGKNLFDIADNAVTAQTETLYTKTDTGYRVYNTNANTYRHIRVLLDLPQNADLILTTSMSVTSGMGMVVMEYSDDNTNWTNGNWTGNPDASSTNKDYVLNGNTGTHPYWRMVLFSTRGTSEIGDITYSNIMLRDASILDDTFEPYHESVEEVVGDIRAGQAVLGAKNQIYYPYYSSYTTDWIDDGDGKVKLNGTISSRITFVLIHHSQPHNVPSGKYILSKGFVSSNVGYSCGVIIEAYNNDTWVKNLASSDGTDKITFDIDYNGYNKINVYLYATAGTYSNLVFKPMLRLASDPDDTYVPYAMTNRELTEELAVQESAVTDIVSGASITNNHNNLYKQGKFVNMCIEIAHVTATAYDTVIGKIPSDFKPRTFAVDCNTANVQVARIYVDNSGNMKSRIDLTDASFVATATWITN